MFDKSAFIQGYITAALWTSMDTREGKVNPSGEGPALDGPEYGEAKLGKGVREELERQCRHFLFTNQITLGKAAHLRPSDYLGHDFWLTRNRHGCGFLDRDLPDEMAERLYAASHKAKEVSLYVGDDGMIYVD